MGTSVGDADKCAFQQHIELLIKEGIGQLSLFSAVVADTTDQEEIMENVLLPPRAMVNYLAKDMLFDLNIYDQVGPGGIWAGLGGVRDLNLGTTLIAFGKYSQR